MHLVGFWRDASALIHVQAEQRARGEENVDLETPLDTAKVDGLANKFESRYGPPLEEDEILWSHLLNRIPKEVDRKNHQVIHIARIGSEQDAGRSMTAKKFKI